MAPACTAATATLPAPASTAPRAAQVRGQLAKVRTQIAAITTAQHATAARRDAINVKLAAQATRLDAAAGAVRTSDAAIAAKSAATDQLQQQYVRLGATLASQREALAALLRAAYTLNRSPGVALLLGDGDIAKADRALAYAGYFQRARVARIRALVADATQLDTLKTSIATETAALEQQRNERAQQQADLERARTAQQQLLATANAELAAQKGQLTALQRNAKALDQLLKRLENVFADIPSQIGTAPAFTQLRGRLPWPVAGKPHAGTVAQGVVIAARPDAKVHAVAYGRVAYASFMRGFDMLVIIDHGNGWMSLYGGNEAALVETGAWVKPGQVIATVARHPEQGGAWFGLRHNGVPANPRGWLAPRD